VAGIRGLDFLSSTYNAFSLNSLSDANSHYVIMVSLFIYILNSISILYHFPLDVLFHRYKKGGNLADRLRPAEPPQFLD